MGVNQNISGLKRDGRSLAIAPKVLTRRLLRRGARYRTQSQTKQSPTKKPISARYRLFSNLSQAAEDLRKTKK